MCQECECSRHGSVDDHCLGTEGQVSNGVSIRKQVQNNNVIMMCLKTFTCYFDSSISAIALENLMELNATPVQKGSMITQNANTVLVQQLDQKIHQAVILILDRKVS